MSVLFGDRKKVTVVGVIGLAVALVGSLTFIVPLGSCCSAQWVLPAKKPRI